MTLLHLITPHQLKQQITYMIVIKNLQPTIPTSFIMYKLTDKEFAIRNVSNIRSWKAKEQLPMFFVDQETNDTNKKLYEFSQLQNKIVVEPSYKERIIPQCPRCHDYGHSKTYCTKAYHSVKCAGSYPTSEDRKSKNSPLICVQ